MYVTYMVPSQLFSQKARFIYQKESIYNVIDSFKNNLVIQKSLLHEII